MQLTLRAALLMKKKMKGQGEERQGGDGEEG
jgi:hypothetical protein